MRKPSQAIGRWSSELPRSPVGPPPRDRSRGPTRRYGPLPKKLVVQSEDVLVDARGYIYLTEKNQGLWILQYTELR